MDHVLHVHRYFRGCSKLCLSHRTALQDFPGRNSCQASRAGGIHCLANKRSTGNAIFSLTFLLLYVKQPPTTYSHRVCTYGMHEHCCNNAAAVVLCGCFFTYTMYAKQTQPRDPSDLLSSTYCFLLYVRVHACITASIFG